MLACWAAARREAIAVSQSRRSLSVSGIPRAIRRTLSAECSSSPSRYATPRAPASRDPTTVLPAPETPITQMRRASCLLFVATELVAERREQFCGEVSLAARRKALVQGGGEHRHRDTRFDRGGDRPAALTGIGHVSREPGKVRLGGEGAGGEIEQ